MAQPVVAYVVTLVSAALVVALAALATVEAGDGLNLQRAAVSESVAVWVMVSSLALLGRVSLNTGGAELFGVDLAASGHATGLPLLLTGVYFVVNLQGARWAERRLPATETRRRWVLPAVSAASGSVVSFVAASSSTLVLGPVHLSAVSWSLALGSFVLTFGASWLGRTKLRGLTSGSAERRPGLSPDVGAAVTTWLVHLGMSAPLVAVVLVVAGLAQEGPRALGLVPLALPTLALWGYGLVNMSWLTVGGSGAALGLVDVNDGTVGLWDLGTGLGVGGTLLALLTAVAAALWWWVRRDRSGTALRRPTSWCLLPGTFAAGGVLLTMLTPVRLSASASGLEIGGTLAFGPTAWTFVVMAVVGLVVETMSRHLAPHILPLLPPALAAGPAGGTTTTRPASTVPTFPGEPAGAPGTGTEETGSTSAVQTSEAAEAAEATGAADGRKTDPTTRRRLKVGFISAASLGALLVLGAMAVSLVNSRVYGPERQVEAYLDALVAGDLETAMSVHEPNIARAQRVLLTEEVYAAAEHSIEAYTVTSTVIVGDVATVTSEVSLDGERIPATFVLDRAGRAAGLFDRWRLSSDDLLATASLFTGGKAGTVVVNGVEIPLPEPTRRAGQGSGVWELPVLPGTYTVALPGNRWVTSAPVSLTARPGEHVDVPAMTFEPSEALREEVQAQVDAHLERCLAATTFRVEDCPNSVYPAFGEEGEEWRHARWTLDAAPEVEVVLRPSEVLLWGLSTVSPGEATVHYEIDTSWTGEPEWTARTRTTSISLGGPVTIDGETVTVEFEE